MRVLGSRDDRRVSRPGSPRCSVCRVHRWSPHGRNRHLRRPQRAGRCGRSRPCRRRWPSPSRSQPPQPRPAASASSRRSVARFPRAGGAGCRSRRPRVHTACSWGSASSRSSSRSRSGLSRSLRSFSDKSGSASPSEPGSGSDGRCRSSSWPRSRRRPAAGTSSTPCRCGRGCCGASAPWQARRSAPARPCSSHTARPLPPRRSTGRIRPRNSASSPGTRPGRFDPSLQGSRARRSRRSSSHGASGGSASRP